MSKIFEIKFWATPLASPLVTFFPISFCEVKTLALLGSSFVIAKFFAFSLRIGVTGLPELLFFWVEEISWFVFK